MIEPWQKSWESFVDILRQRLATGNTSEVANQIGDKIVEWAGVLDEKSIDKLAPLVGIAMSEQHIDLGNGHYASLDGISLPLSEHSIADWSRVDVGSQVRFRAKIGSARSPFSPIEVKHLRTGESVIMIRLSDGTLLG